MAVLFVTVTLLLAFCRAQDTGNKVNVTTSLGIVTGLFVTNKNVEYFSFKGIPYANVTERFKGPTPMKPWQSTVMAFSDGPVCPQYEHMFKILLTHTPQEEECLYINIFTPNVPKEGDRNCPKLPVMVFIHGGGFIMGSSTSFMVGPEYFMEGKDVIIVTFNYRVGFFGFLSTGSEDAQGNAGMKDQVEALKWVKQEIEHFGGDPSRVTIFGESAGAASVALHMISPMSKGLFHAAIVQSGAAMADWANIEGSIARRRATRLAEMLYCNTENTTTIVNCLRKMSVSAINEATLQLVTEEGTMLTTLPVTEPGEFYEEMFLPDASGNLFDNLDTSSSVPLIIGTNKDEGMMMLLFGDQMFQHVDRNLHLLIPSSVRKHLTPEQLGARTQKLRQYYFNGESVTQATVKGFVNLWTDYLFMYPTVENVRKLVAKENSVYLYHFAYIQENPFPFMKDMPKIDYEGVTHGAELAFLFCSSIFGQNMTDTVSNDYKMRKRLVKLWTTFAKTGSPVSITDETIKDIKWPKVPSTSELTYLEMNSTFSVCKNYYEERVAFWDQLTSNSDMSSKDEL